MKLGISSYSLPWSVGINGWKPCQMLTAKNLIEIAIEQNLSLVQFGDNLPLDKLSENDLVQLKEFASQNDIQIEVGTRRLTIQNIIIYLSIAKILNSPFIRFVIDDKDYHPSEETIVEIIQSALPCLKAAGIKLAIENHDRFSAKTLESILNKTDTEFIGICLDTANSLGAGEGIHEIVDILAPYTFNLHIKDFAIERVEHKMGFKVYGCAAGDGALDIDWLVNELKQHPKCKTAVLELWSDPAPTIQETISNEKQQFQKSIDFLKQLFYE